MNYEYRCPKCGHIFTREFPFTKNPEFTACPQCACLLAARFFGTVPPVMYVGHGWAGKSELDARDPRNDNPLDFSDLTGGE